MALSEYAKTAPFFRRHALTLAISWHCSLVIGFALPALLDALVFTDDSSNPDKARARYNATFKHLIDWHLGDIFDPRNAGFKSLQAVRNMHAGIRSALNTQLPGKCPDGKQWMSQYNMACVQSGFMGGITTMPTAFGLVATEEDLRGYVYFWKCCGYQLGISDEYNLCGQ